MSRTYYDYRNKEQGKLLILDRTTPPEGRMTANETWWLCQCECGNVAKLTQTQIKAGRKDCGCETPLSHGGTGRRKRSQSRQELKTHPYFDRFLYQWRMPTQ